MGVLLHKEEGSYSGELYVYPTHYKGVFYLSNQSGKHTFETNENPIISPRGVMSLKHIYIPKSKSGSYTAYSFVFYFHLISTGPDHYLRLNGRLLKSDCIIFHQASFNHLLTFGHFDGIFYHCD